jgi:hypothetical protein
MRRLALGVGIGVLIAAAFFRRPLWQVAAAVPQRLSPDLDDLTKDELYRRAQKADIAGRSEMTKDELVRALKRR